MRLIIIGGGTAGMSTATRLRRLDENVEIVILEKTSEFAVSSCGLTYYLSGLVKNRNELIGTSIEAMRSMYNIEIRLNSEVTAINRAEKTVSIEGKENESYDKLVIAIGAYQLRPDVDGILADNIFTIRNLGTIETIKTYIKDMGVKNVVIVGGGLIGIEVAESFVMLGLKPTIVEAASHLMPSLDNDMASILQNHIREKGIGLYLNEKVTAFGEKTAVLTSGYKIAYEMAIIATGVKPDLKLSVLSELELGKSGGLKVNEQMQTSDPDIYAAGDDVEITNLITGREERMSHAGLAIKQARVIADNLGGIEAKFGKMAGSAICKCFDLDVASIGANEKNLQEAGIEFQKLHLYGSTHSGYYPGAERILFKLLFNSQGQLLGAQAIGKNGIDKRIDILLGFMTSRANYKALIEAEISYAPPFSTGKDIVNELGGAIENILSKREKMAFVEDVDWDNVNGETMLIDVRSSVQFINGHIAKAINIPMEAIRNNLDAIAHDKRVILYCNRGYRAYLTSCILNNRGFDNIYVLSGGMDLYNEILEDKQIRNESYERIVNM